MRTGISEPPDGDSMVPKLPPPRARFGCVSLPAASPAGASLSSPATRAEGRSGSAIRPEAARHLGVDSACTQALVSADGGATARRGDLSSSGSLPECVEQPSTRRSSSEVDAGLSCRGATRRPLLSACCGTHSQREVAEAAAGKGEEEQQQQQEEAAAAEEVNADAEAAGAAEESAEAPGLARQRWAHRRHGRCGGSRVVAGRSRTRAARARSAVGPTPGAERLRSGRWARRHRRRHRRPRWRWQWRQRWRPRRPPPPPPLWRRRLGQFDRLQRRVAAAAARSAWGSAASGGTWGWGRSHPPSCSPRPTGTTGSRAGAVGWRGGWLWARHRRAAGGRARRQHATAWTHRVAAWTHRVAVWMHGAAAWMA